MHPPQHLKDQLLQNGKANLLIKQATLLAMHQQHQHHHQQQHLFSNPATILTTAIPTSAAHHHHLGTATPATATPHPSFLPLNGTQPQLIGYQQIIANGQAILVPVVAPQTQTLQFNPTQSIYDPTTHQVIQHPQQHALASTHHNALLPHQRTDRLTVSLKKTISSILSLLLFFH